MANNSPALTGNSQPQHQAAAAAAQQQQQCGGGGATKPAVSGKQGNVLPLWGNEKTMNLNPMILTNILSSPYFKVQLYELKTYHEVVDEIYFKVRSVWTWEVGTKFRGGGTEETGGGGPRGLIICRWGRVGRRGKLWPVVRQGGVKLGPPSHFLFRFLGPGEPAAIDLSSPSLQPAPGGGG